MKAASMFFVISLAALVSVKPWVDACGPSTPHPSGPYDPFNLTTNKTKELGYLSELTILKLGARRGIEEGKKQLKDKWNLTFIEERVDPELPIFVNTTLPYNTRETAFLHAISAAAITYEFTLKCRHNIRGCKCARRRSPWSSRNRVFAACGDNIEFGISRTKSFIDQLEKEKDPRTVVNLHNNKVGREVVRSSLRLWCRCHGFNSSCSIRTCWMNLPPFEDIVAELKKKVEYAVPVHVSFVKKVFIDQQSRPISKRLVDKSLVFLNHPSGFCVRNDTSGTPEMLGKTCRCDDMFNSPCILFRTVCSSCGLTPKTVEEFEEVKCLCKLDKICLKSHWLTTCKPKKVKAVLVSSREDSGHK